MGRSRVSEWLLLSGGMDSAALAAWRRPARCVFVDYGQRPAAGEERAAGAVAGALGLAMTVVRADCSAVGAGPLAGRQPAGLSPNAEWWPFRNQLLVTLGGSVAVRDGATALVIGTVSGDGGRHADGTPEFVAGLGALMARQEGGLRLLAPAIEMTPVELVSCSGIGDEVLGWTHSCHRAASACGSCSGCWKRRVTLDELGRLP
jgi:7-cyano-7-deazaguanine synthase